MLREIQKRDSKWTSMGENYSIWDRRIQYMRLNGTCDATEENINVVIPQFLQVTVSRSPYRYKICNVWVPYMKWNLAVNTIGTLCSRVSHRRFNQLQKPWISAWLHLQVWNLWILRAVGTWRLSNRNNLNETEKSCKDKRISVRCDTTLKLQAA